MYYASCDANGPISVRMESTEEFSRLTHQEIDDCLTHAEDDLGFCAEGMSEDEFCAAMESHGYTCRESAGIAGEWRLWSPAE